jgi:hypothetical protein
LGKKFNLPLTNYFLTETQIKSILNFKLWSALVRKKAATRPRLPRCFYGVSTIF